MKILATGGAGYVGSAVLRELLARGHEAWAYDNLSKGYRLAVPPDKLIEADLEDYDRLVQVLREKKTVKHLGFSQKSIELLLASSLTPEFRCS